MRTMKKQIEIPEGYEARIEGNKVILECKMSEDERIRKELINFVANVKDIANSGRDSWAVRKEDIEMCERFLAYLEKQKEQISDIVLKAFENSKTDYSLEEREEASDYSEKVLPTSVVYGENKEEYLLHKVIEAAYIAGRKEQKPAEWSEEDEEWIDYFERLLEYGYNHDHRGFGRCCIAGKMWLKSFHERLNSQPHWKPSEEQMEALKWSMNAPEEVNNYVKRNLKSLHNDLEKL